MNINSLLGAVAQSGMRRSSSSRIATSLGGGGLMESLTGMLGGASGTGLRSAGVRSGGARGGVLGSILSDAGRAVGGNQNLALGGLGALAGAVLGGGRRSVRGALGGGVMALLGVMAYQALKAKAGQKTTVPVGFAVPQGTTQEAELERNSRLVLKAMMNAAKADGQVDEDEIQRILGKVEENGADQEARDFLAAEMRKPMETATLVAAGRGNPELAAEIYSASLLAIEVDTPAEKEYLRDLAAGMGLDAEVTQRIHEIVGLQ